MVVGQLDGRTVDVGGREEPHILATKLTGAGSKQLTLGLSTGAAADFVFEKFWTIL